MYRALTLLIVPFIALMGACNEPVAFDPNGDQGPAPMPDPNPQPEPMPDMDVAEPDPNPEPPMPDVMPDGGEMIVIEPDKDIFAQVVMPILRGGCDGPICHAATAVGRQFTIDMGADPSEEVLDANLDKVLDWVDFEAPSSSQLLTQPIRDPSCCENHPDALIQSSDDYRLVLEWIQDSIKIITPDMPDAGVDPEPDPEPEGPQVPCEALPDPENLAGDYDYDAFGQYVNTMLVERCSRIGGCHAVPGNGGGLWIVRGDDECSTTWNYLQSRLFAHPDPTLSLLSPLIDRPLGQQEPNNLHGGSVVFRGQNDCDYVLLKLWLEGDLFTPPQPPACDDN